MNIPNDMKLELVNYDTFEGHSFLTIQYDFRNTSGVLNVSDVNNKKDLCIDTVHLTCLDAYGNDFKEICDTINTIESGKSIDEARSALEQLKINSR